MEEIRIKALWRAEADEWIEGGSKIGSKDKLQRIDAVLKEGPIIVEHWFYRGASAPRHQIFDNYDDFVEYLKTNTRAGDAILVWDWKNSCKENNLFEAGKMADLDGCTPKHGPY